MTWFACLLAYSYDLVCLYICVHRLMYFRKSEIDTACYIQGC